ncbi:serine/threonine-protein kinase [Amycolatopsis mediterranei]|uniref:serine/threonine-protein kinase n=1 Tax=Amycolatopsis mediterranei TaxID=33910 RepID=UPI00344AF03D
MHAGLVIAGRYRLVAQAGSGGNGVVWRAVDEELDRPVALKRALPGDPSRYVEQMRQLRREARLLAQLNHRHIVTLYDVVEDDGECWLVMEYVPALSMADRGALPAKQVARLGAQAADALAAVHAKGILHRDITPGNILLVSDDDVKLGDFGIARVVASEETLTGSALLAGTPGYVAPEVANGNVPTAASDVFSLGSTLFAAVEGTTPVGGKSDNGFLRLRRAAEGHLAPSRNGGPLTPVLSRLLAVDPAQRPTAAEAHRLLADVGGVPAAEVSVPRRRIRRRLLYATGAVVVVLGSAVWFTFSSAAGNVNQTATPPPGSLLGDPRTADPCGLIDDAPLDHFGHPNLVRDEWGFDQCDVIVKNTAQTKESDVTVRLAETLAADAVPVEVENHGGFGVVRDPAGAGSCVRRLLLADRYEVRIEAQQHTLDVDACVLADVVTDHAVGLLAKGPIPRRNRPDPRSLITQDACALGNPERFPRAPGVERPNPVVGFGHWTCTWTSADGSLTLKIAFGRTVPLKEMIGDRRQIAGRDAVVGPGIGNTDTCDVAVLNYTYVDASLSQKMEGVYVDAISKQKTQDERCALALQLANAYFPPR